jgi:hypothetical protein
MGYNALGGEIMKILNITDPKAFFEKVNKCKGEIFLLTSEGDKLNLRSTLCQYIALSDVFSSAKIDSIEIQVTEPDDMNLLINYLIQA